MSSEIKWRSVRSCAARVLQVDACGLPVTGGTPMAVTQGHIKVDYKFNTNAGDELTQKNACGITTVSDKAPDTLQWIDLSATFDGVDPDLVRLMAGYPSAFDYLGNPVGYDVETVVSTAATGFALELWTQIPGQACETGAGGMYGYFLLPWVRDVIESDFSLENGVANFAFNGRGVPAHQWGVGPFNVQQTNAGGAAGKLITPVGSTRPLRRQIVTIPPPAITNGAVAFAP